MPITFRKLLLALLATLMGVFGSGAIAAPVAEINVGGTNYNFTYVTGTFNSYSALLESQPWWGNNDVSMTFVNALNNAGNPLGFPFYGLISPAFAVSLDTFVVRTTYVQHYCSPYPSTGLYGSLADTDQPISYAVVSVAPEMNASLIPQVGLLLACLFFLSGRKKEVVEPLLTA